MRLNIPQSLQFRDVLASETVEKLHIFQSRYPRACLNRGYHGDML